MEEEVKVQHRKDTVIDPFVQRRQLMMDQSEFRTIEIGDSDLLSNGRMIQVSVCDPFDEKLFHPTDKVIICKYNNQYYALGSFCGFDYTNLGTGVFLG